jgi:hypothetical protein
MRVSRRFIPLILVLVVLVVLPLLFEQRIKAATVQLWAMLHPATAQSGTTTVGTVGGSSYEVRMHPARAPIDTDDLDDHISRVAALMARMPRFGQAELPPQVRWIRFRPNWLLDTATATSSGQLWVTVWPKVDLSDPPEYVGTLYGGNLRQFHLPGEPYESLKLDY